MLECAGFLRTLDLSNFNLSCSWSQISTPIATMTSLVDWDMSYNPGLTVCSAALMHDTEKRSACMHTRVVQAEGLGCMSCTTLFSCQGCAAKACSST